MKLWPKILLGVGSIILLSIIYIFLFGPLFSLGPKFGYAKENHSQVILVSKDPSLFNTINDIDKIVEDEETFHGLDYKRKVKIVLATSKSEFKMFLPQLPSGIGGATLQVCDTIYLNTAKINEHGYDINGYIRHELSHELLYQNADFLKAYKMLKQFWPEEGIATYFGGPFDYFESTGEYLTAFKAANLKISDDPTKLYDGLTESGGKISYTTYRYFVGYMDTTYGREKLQQFVNLYTNNPANLENDFHTVFGLSIQEAVNNFDQDFIQK